MLSYCVSPQTSPRLFLYIFISNSHSNNCNDHHLFADGLHIHLFSRLVFLDFKPCSPTSDSVRFLIFALLPFSSIEVGTYLYRLKKAHLKIPIFCLQPLPNLFLPQDQRIWSFFSFISPMPWPHYAAKQFPSSLKYSNETLLV